MALLPQFTPPETVFNRNQSCPGDSFQSCTNLVSFVRHLVERVLPSADLTTYCWATRSAVTRCRVFEELRCVKLLLHEQSLASLTADMAEKTPKEPAAPFATRIDPTKEGLSKEQMHFIRQIELEQWKRKTQKLRGRNVVTGLAIGALVMGICILAKHTR